MDNDQLPTEMSDEEFTATLKRLQAHAQNQADQAFKAGDRKRFDIWDVKAGRLKSIASIDELRDMAEGLKA